MMDAATLLTTPQTRRRDYCRLVSQAAEYLKLAYPLALGDMESDLHDSAIDPRHPSERAAELNARLLWLEEEAAAISQMKEKSDRARQMEEEEMCAWLDEQDAKMSPDYLGNYEMEHYHG